uniref:Uncharacterized protein n=1 Tax=Arundo donax TaxID=35708 RepID=A0A0A8YGE3_ARUDO
MLPIALHFDRYNKLHD